jgi:hypothetical protein
MKELADVECTISTEGCGALYGAAAFLKAKARLKQSLWCPTRGGLRRAFGCSNKYKQKAGTRGLSAAVRNLSYAVHLLCQVRRCAFELPSELFVQKSLFTAESNCRENGAETLVGNLLVLLVNDSEYNNFTGTQPTAL